jgi:hypothetical protein
MPAGSTYSTIATTTVSGTGTSTITFSSIGTYTDIILVMNAAVTDGYAIMRVNNDSTTLYSRTQLSGNGSSASSGRTSSDDGWFPITGTTGFTSITTVHLMNYSNTTTNKTALARGNNTSGLTQASAWLYRSTSAITRIDLIRPGTDNFLSGSTFTLYGISAA